MHDTDLVYVSCDAKWHFSDCGDTWTLHHFGSHNHAAPYCMDKLTREERWKVFEQMRRLEKSGKMDELTVDAFNESMQFSEEFRIFMQQTPDQSEDDSYE